MKKLPVYLRVYKVIISIYIFDVLAFFLQIFLLNLDQDNGKKISWQVVLTFTFFFSLFCFKILSSFTLLRNYEENKLIKGWSEVFFVAFSIFHVLCTIAVFALTYSILFEDSGNLQDKLTFSNITFILTFVFSLYILIMDLIVFKSIERNHEKSIQNQINSINTTTI